MSLEQIKIVTRFLKQESTSKSIARYVLKHVPGKRQTPNEVETFEITEALAPEDMEALASTIHGRAQMDADGLGPAVHAYVLYSFEKAGEEYRQSSRVIFRVRGIHDDSFDEIEDVEAEIAGSDPGLKQLTGQLMRHNEANNRTMVGSWGSMLTHMARQMESRDKMIEKMYEQRQKDFEAIERARSEEATRQLEFYKEQSRQQRFDMALRKATTLAPVLLNHLTGGKVAGDASPIMLMLKEFKNTLTQDQLMAIAGKLQPAQAIALMEIIKSIPKDKEENSEQKTLTDGSENGVVS